jgi:hypothetical protein
MHVDFDPQHIKWEIYTENPEFEDSHSDPLQFGNGGGIPHYNAFNGMPYQRGAGIGSIFRSLLRFLIPIGRKAGIAIGKQGLESGARVINNVLGGNDLKQTLAEEGKEGLKNLLDKASQNLSRQQGQSGSGNFDFKRYRTLTNKPASNEIGIGHVGNGPPGSSSDNVGVFTRAPLKHINKRRYTTFPPPTISLPKKRRSSIPSQTGSIRKIRKNPHIRIDALGTY